MTTTPAALFAAESALWRIDAVSVLLLVLVVGIAAAVLPYAHRSLRGDRHGRAVTAAIAVMLTATAVVSIAGELWMLALGWSLATAATLAALGLGGGRPAITRSAGWLLVGDLALWAAVALDAAAVAGDAIPLLLVIAAVLRCALPPAHPWLVDSLHAPTPVSAALHGGIVNGGGILVITQIDVIAPSAVAITVLATAAAIAIVAGAIAALVRTDVKGRLVMSTVAQMGFMLLCAALGLVAAAVLHLVAHGFYKSALFLSSSDGIDRRAADRRAPRALALAPGAQTLRAVGGGLVSVTALVIAALALYPADRGAAELVVLVAVGAAFGAVGARFTALVPGTARALAAMLLSAGAAVAFVVVTSALTVALGLTRPDPSGAAPLVLALAAGVMLALVGLAALRRWAPSSRLALTVIAFGLGLGARPLRARSARSSRAEPSPESPSKTVGTPRNAPSIGVSA